MTAKAKVDRRLPRGVYALSLLMFLAGGILLLAALILPIQGTNFVGASVVPWYFYIGYAAYFLVVGWGLWAGRRWAYLAALLMCVVLAFYQFRTAIVLGTRGDLRLPHPDRRPECVPAGRRPAGAESRRWRLGAFADCRL